MFKMMLNLTFCLSLLLLNSQIARSEDYFTPGEDYIDEEEYTDGPTFILEARSPGRDKYAALPERSVYQTGELVSLSPPRTPLLLPVPAALPEATDSLSEAPITLSKPIVASAEPLPPPVLAPVRLDDMLFSDVPVVLTPKEQYAVEMVQPWQNQTEIGVHPISGAGGAVQYAYGLERPSVLCAVWQLTDIELEAGEVIQSINIGDSTRWIIDSALSGNDTPHLLVKPMDVGLDTSLAVATDRRMYHLRLRSTRNDFLARVNFTYPADAARKLEEMKTAAAKAEAERQKERETALEKEVERDTIPETREYLGALDFDYTVTGTARWKPTRVYNDGHKTIIEMPANLHQDDSPTLLALRKRNGLFRKDEEVLVNYRVQKNRYVVDAVFEKAMLIVGVGRGQTRVIIERGNGRTRGGAR